MDLAWHRSVPRYITNRVADWLFNKSDIFTKRNENTFDSTRVTYHGIWYSSKEELFLMSGISVRNIVVSHTTTKIRKKYEIS